MANTVPNLPLQQPLVTPQTGYITQSWIGFLTQLYIRIGENQALTNKELETLNSGDLANLAQQVSAIQASINSLSFDQLGKGRVL